MDNENNIDEKNEETETNMVDQDKLSVQLKDTFYDIRSTMRNKVELTNFDDFYRSAKTQIDMLIKFLKQYSAERNSLLKQLEEFEKDEQFKIDYDSGLVQTKHYDIVSRNVKLDRDYIIPYFDLIKSLAPHCFDVASSLVDVNKTIGESKVFIQKYEGLQKQQTEFTKLMIENTHKIAKDLIAAEKQRSDGKIKELELSQSKYKAQVIDLAFELRYLKKIVLDKDEFKKDDAKKNGGVTPPLHPTKPEKPIPTSTIQPPQNTINPYNDTSQLHQESQGQQEQSNPQQEPTKRMRDMEIFIKQYKTSKGKLQGISGAVSRNFKPRSPLEEEYIKNVIDKLKIKTGDTTRNDFGV